MRLYRRNPMKLAFLTVLLITLLGVCAGAAAKSVVAAVDANDVAALQRLSQTAATRGERSLAAGTVLALRREDAKATARLMLVTRSAADRLVRATAYIELAEIYLRDQRYLSSYSAFRASLRLSPTSLNVSERQDMGFAEALAHVKPMQLLSETPGSVPIKRDKLNLIRMPVRIDGRSHQAVVDTGAGFSTISASAAKSAGIRMIRQQLSVGTASKQAVMMQLGIAPRLQFGKAILTNVVFIVLPDSDLSFPNGYRVNAVVGLPVLMALGRVTFVNSGMPAMLYDPQPGRPASRTRSQEDMLLFGLTPLVLAHLPGAETPLRMILDSGAPSTEFSHNALADEPTLLAHGKRYVSLPAVGAGGVVMDRRALMLPEVTFSVGGRQFKLNNVPVSSLASAISSDGIDGMLGQNVLRQGGRWTIDFSAMRLVIAN